MHVRFYLAENILYKRVCVCHWGNIFEMQVWILGDVCWTTIYMKCLWKVLYFHFLYLLSVSFSNSVPNHSCKFRLKHKLLIGWVFLGILVDPHWKIPLLSILIWSSSLEIPNKKNYDPGMHGIDIELCVSFVMAPVEPRKVFLFRETYHFCWNFLIHPWISASNWGGTSQPCFVWI